MRLFARRQKGTIGDTVLLVEHDPVITKGKSAKSAHILASEQSLLRQRIPVVETGRGGDVTLHAPGQLVCYPLLDLNPDCRDVRRYVGALTETMRRLVNEYGVQGGQVPEHVGLWVDEATPSSWPGPRDLRRPAKIGAIGVRISRWVTMHGFALNLTTDLELFRLIVPCGITEYSVTSVQALTGTAVALDEAAPRALSLLTEVLGRSTAEFQNLAGAPLEEALCPS